MLSTAMFIVIHLEFTQLDGEISLVSESCHDSSSGQVLFSEECRFCRLNMRILWCCLLDLACSWGIGVLWAQLGTKALCRSPEVEQGQVCGELWWSTGGGPKPLENKESLPGRASHIISIHFMCFTHVWYQVFQCLSSIFNLHPVRIDGRCAQWS